jgi:hypothetical protein
MISVMPSNRVAEDGSCLLVFNGPVNRMVVWNLSGPGSLAILSEVTDANGVAMARYNPGTAGDTPTVTVTYAS